jgi:hypothetical protein
MGVLTSLRELEAFVNNSAIEAFGGSRRAKRDLPSSGEILAYLSQQRLGGQEYDKKWPERVRSTLW